MATLADRIKKNFCKVKLKRASVNVPDLRIRKKRTSKAREQSKVPTATIVNILIRNAVEEARKGRIERNIFANSKRAINAKKAINGGYGTASRLYGTSSREAYVDYGKLFSYIGKFKSQSPYENYSGESPTEKINKIMEQDSKFYLVDREVIDDGVRSIKYFTFGLMLREPGPVPMGGINSADWEKFKLWKLVDYVMFNLKMSTL